MGDETTNRRRGARRRSGRRAPPSTRPRYQQQAAQEAMPRPNAGAAVQRYHPPRVAPVATPADPIGPDRAPRPLHASGATTNDEVAQAKAKILGSERHVTGETVSRPVTIGAERSMSGSAKGRTVNGAEAEVGGTAGDLATLSPKMSSPVGRRTRAVGRRRPSRAVRDPRSGVSPIVALSLRGLDEVGQQGVRRMGDRKRPHRAISRSVSDACSKRRDVASRLAGATVADFRHGRIRSFGPTSTTFAIEQLVGD